MSEREMYISKNDKNCMKKFTKIDIAIAIFYLIAIISLFFPYSILEELVGIDELNKVIYKETSYFWYENYAIFVVLGFTVLIVITSFSERNWINKVRNIVFSLFAIGTLGLIAIGTRMGVGEGFIPDLTFNFYLMNFAILSIIIAANVKTWLQEN